MLKRENGIAMPSQGNKTSRSGISRFDPIPAFDDSSESCGGAMSEQTPLSPDRLNWESLAADALELARRMPPGPERNEALKLAGLLRRAADARGLIVPKRARPRNGVRRRAWHFS
jgi:hypothetical protein